MAVFSSCFVHSKEQHCFSCWGTSAIAWCTPHLIIIAPHLDSEMLLGNPPELLLRSSLSLPFRFRFAMFMLLVFLFCVLVKGVGEKCCVLVRGVASWCDGVRRALMTWGEGLGRGEVE